MNPLLKPLEADDAQAIAESYLYLCRGDHRAAMIRIVEDSVSAIQELRSELEEARQAVSYGYVRGRIERRQ